MLRHEMVSDKPSGLSVQSPPPGGKLAALLKSLFGDFCCIRFNWNSHRGMLPRAVLRDKLVHSTGGTDWSRATVDRVSTYKVPNRVPCKKEYDAYHKLWNCWIDAMTTSVKRWQRKPLQLDDSITDVFFSFIHLFVLAQYISGLVLTDTHKYAEILSLWFFVTLAGLQKTFDNMFVRGVPRIKLNTAFN